MTIFERLFSLEGKTALVTGGATGIGRMISTALVEAGATVMITSRKGEDCKKVAAELNELAQSRESRGSATGFGGDVSTEQGILELVKNVRAETDHLNILFNNSGTTWGAPIDGFPFSAWSRVLDVNVTGLFHLTQQLLPLLEEAATSEDPSRVVNIGSVMGSAPLGAGAYSYAASKAAVHHLTRILGKELAGRSITFNGFAPGPFPSKMTVHATGSDEKARAVSNRVPLGRLGRADDIAAAALYLCGPGGSYVTGAILPIDGGVHLQTGPDLF